MLKKSELEKKTASQNNIMQQVRIRNLSVTSNDKYNVCYNSKLHALFH